MCGQGRSPVLLSPGLLKLNTVVDSNKPTFFWLFYVYTFVFWESFSMAVSNNSIVWKFYKETIIYAIRDITLRSEIIASAGVTNGTTSRSFGMFFYVCLIFLPVCPCQWCFPCIQRILLQTINITIIKSIKGFLKYNKMEEIKKRSVHQRWDRPLKNPNSS